MSDPGTEIATEAAKAAAVEIIKPVTGIVGDVLGSLIGDKIRNWRTAKPAWQERNQRETAARAAKMLADRGVKKASEHANPVDVEEIIEASKNTTSEELRDLYAKLVAAAMDPARITLYRREFVGIVNQLEPIDALVLPRLAETAEMIPSRVENIASHIGASDDAIRNAIRNLNRMQLTLDDPSPGVAPKSFPQVTSLGRQFLACVR